jgi:hypothetical protein
MVPLIDRSSSSSSSSSDGGGGSNSSSSSISGGSSSNILYPTYLLLSPDNINIRSAKDRLKVSIRFKVKM